MRSYVVAATVLLLLPATTAAGEPPRVATDIAPIQSLAAQVMDGVGAPSLVIRVGASPHGYALRPSEAQALAEADIVFWTSAALTPTFPQTIEALAGDAVSVELLEVEGTKRLNFRTSAAFAHEKHDDDHDHGHGDESGVDPHAWLDPENAKVWLGAIASTLAAADPENEAVYRANEAAGKAEIDALIEQARAETSGLRDNRYVVFHDAYQYFEHRFGIPVIGAISLGDAAAPSPSRIAEIKAALAESGASCVFAEPQFNAGLVAAVFEGTEAKTAVIDPLGATIEPGSSFYRELILGLARDMAACR